MVELLVTKSVSSERSYTLGGDTKIIPGHSGLVIGKTRAAI